MSVHTLFLIAIGGGVLMLAALAGLVITLVVEDRRADREDREQHGHARPRESWRTRFQAWVTPRFGARTGVSLWRRLLAWVYAPVNVPALVTTLPPGTSAGTPTSQRPPRAAVTVQGRVCEESASVAVGGALVPDAALDPIHRIDLQMERLYAAGENERAGYWHPSRPGAYLSSGGWNPLALGSTDTGYSKKDAALLGVILEGDAATVLIRRRFADLEIRDQARFDRVVAGIRTVA